MNTARPQQRRRTTTRLRLLEAGRRLLAEQPIDALTIDDIVAAAGVGKGSFYNHFADKQAFAEGVAAAVRVRLERLIEATNHEVRDPAQRVVRAFAASLNFGLTDPLDARLMVTGHELAARSDHFLNSGLLADLEAGRASGCFSVGDLDGATLLVLGTNYLALRRVVQEALSLSQVRRLARSSGLLLLRGLGVDNAQARTHAENAVTEVVTGRRLRQLPEGEVHE